MLLFWAFILAYFPLQQEVTARVTFPEPMGYVNDFASVLDANVRNAMESYARELEKKSGVEIVVVTIKTTGEMDYNEYANRLYENWGIGRKGSDEGILILNAVEDRTVRIEVGYGLEGLIPDGKAGEIRDLMTPYLKQGDYSGGLFRGFAELAGIIARDKNIELTGSLPQQTARQRHAATKKGMSGLVSLLVFLLFIIMMGRRRTRSGLFLPLIFLSGMGHRSSGGFGSGFSGGFGGGFSGFGGGMSGGGGAGGSY